MTGTEGGTTRGRLLLFVLLLFGILAMHTMGHPSGHGAGHEPGTTDTHASASASTMRHAPAMPAAPPHASVAARASVADEPSMPGGDMDPLNVCLAVLGTAVLLLLTAAVLRPLTAGAPVPVRRGMAYAQRPHPPPPRTLLARLSVLRI